MATFDQLLHRQSDGRRGQVKSLLILCPFNENVRRPIDGQKNAPFPPIVDIRLEAQGVVQSRDAKMPHVAIQGSA